MRPIGRSKEDITLKRVRILFHRKLPVPDVYRTFFVGVSEEIADTIAAIQEFVAAYFFFSPSFQFQFDFRGNGFN
jgi:hypothetical protein